MVRMDTGPCPPADVVAAFVAGELTDVEVRALEPHLDRCDLCLALVGGLGHAASAELVTGAQVGRYEILSCIGRGAFGVVYAAYDPELDRKVALKLLQRRHHDDELRFLREARAMARVSSPHVVTVHDVGRLDSCLFAAMELVEGETLGALAGDAAPRRARSWPRSRRRVADSLPRTPRNSCTATSSPRTCSSTRAGSSR